MPRDRVKEAVREVKVPRRLVGKTDEEIYDWAKEQLDGIDPDLKHNDIQKIKRGDITKVTLRPSKPGFFLPDGTFVEAYDYDVSMGEDLDEVEGKIEDEQAEREWIEEETDRFNQDVVTDDDRVRQMWEHGRRMDEYMEETGTTPWRIHNKLGDVGGVHTYSLHTHQTCTDLYEWKRDASQDDPVFEWTWQLVDAILKFSSNNEVRDRIQSTVAHLLNDGGLSMRAIAEFLRGSGQSDSKLWAQNGGALEELHAQLARGENLNPEQVAELGRILSRDS